MCGVVGLVCPAYNALHTTHCIRNTEYCVLHTPYCILHTLECLAAARTVDSGLSGRCRLGSIAGPPSAVGEGKVMPTPTVTRPSNPKSVLQRYARSVYICFYFSYNLCISYEYTYMKHTAWSPVPKIQRQSCKIL